MSCRASCTNATAHRRLRIRWPPAWTSVPTCAWPLPDDSRMTCSSCDPLDTLVVRSVSAERTRRARQRHRSAQIHVDRSAARRPRHDQSHGQRTVRPASGVARHCAPVVRGGPRCQRVSGARVILLVEGEVAADGRARWGRTRCCRAVRAVPGAGPRRGSRCRGAARFWSIATAGRASGRRSLATSSDFRGATRVAGNLAGIVRHRQPFALAPVAALVGQVPEATASEFDVAEIPAQVGHQVVRRTTSLVTDCLADRDRGARTGPERAQRGDGARLEAAGVHWPPPTLCTACSAQFFAYASATAASRITRQFSAFDFSADSVKLKLPVFSVEPSTTTYLSWKMWCLWSTASETPAATTSVLARGLAHGAELGSTVSWPATYRARAEATSVPARCFAVGAELGSTISWTSTCRAWALTTAAAIGSLVNWYAAMRTVDRALSISWVHSVVQAPDGEEWTSTARAA